MRKCLYDDCSNTENTPGVEFHEVFDSNEGSKSLELYICSHHLKREFDNQVNPAVPVVEVPAKAAAAGAEKQAGSSAQHPAGSTAQKSAGNGAQGGSASAGKPKKNRHCCAAGCSVSLLTHPDVGLFKFHPSNKRFEKWCLVADLPIRETRLAFVLCARHFHSGCFVDSERHNLKADSDPTYPTGPLNEVTGNYCLYTKEPPLNNCLSGKEPPLPQLTEPPEVIVIDDEPDENAAKELEELEKPEDLQLGSQPLADVPQIVDHGYSLPQSTPEHPSQKGTMVEDSESVIKFCCHRNCNNSSDKNANVRFFRLPNDPDPRVDYWFKATALGHRLRGKLHRNQYHLCSEHFDSSQFEDEFTLKATAMPILDASHKKPPLVLDKSIKCDAVGCPSTYKDDPSVKFFRMGNSRKKDPGSLERWKDMVGGVTTSASRFTICQYHFPEKAFTDPPYRTRLTPRRDYCLFQVGPLNPKTGDYCPKGKEELSIIYHKERILACSVRGCLSTKPLFKFPYYDDKAFDIWCERIGICRKRYSKEYITNILSICGLHFDGRCNVFDTQTNTVFLDYGALPTLKLPNYHGKSAPSTFMLECDTVPPNAGELAHSLLVKPNEGVPAKDIITEIDKLDGITPEKRQKLDVTVEPMIPLKMVMPVKNTRPVTHWAPTDFVEQGSGNKRLFRSGTARPHTVAEDGEKQSNIVPGKVSQQTVIPGNVNHQTTIAFPENSQLTPNIFSGERVPGNKRGPKRKFEPDEDRPSMTIKEFLDDFVGDMSPPEYSPPPSPDAWDPLGKTRDASVQTDSPPETPRVDVPPKKILRKVEETFEELSSIDIGNEVDIPLLVENKTIDRSALNQITKENALERALIGVFNSCKTGDDNAFSGLSDRSTVPEPGLVRGDVHQYSTYETVNVLRSAAQLCEFNNMKVQQLEQLMQQDEKCFSAVEDTLVKHLSAVMCITGVELVKKCFDRVLQDAISREKANEEKSDVMAQIPFSTPNPNQPYSKDTKQMSKVLLAYSGRGFQLLKQIADLPPTYLIRNWSTYPDGSPGFSEQAFKMLKQYHLTSTSKFRMCSLSVVDVPLQKDVTWDGKRPFGLEDFGFGCLDNDCVREATKAVVFYLKFLTENKKLPVGYVLADNLTPQVRANLIIQYICYLDSVGIKCLAVVSDYSVMTYQTFVELGAFVDNLDTGWFHHPYGKGARVMCFTDVFQNVRALSNLWEEKKVFRPSPKADTTIDRDHIALGDAFLKAPQGYSSVPAMAKFLSNLKSHKSQAQNDPLSTNKYNAVMLTILRDLGVKKFSSTSQTIKYLESLTAVTDIFSSTHPYDAADRRSLTYSNCTRIQTRLSSLSAYFSGLCFGSGTKILTTNRKMPVAMLKMNICSLRNLAKRMFYGEKSKKLEFFCKSLSLEDISETVATMCGGAKQLVSATEFKKGFQKYMHDYDWTPSKRLLCDRLNKFPVADLCLGFKNTFTYEYAPFNSVSESALEFLTENVIETWLEKVECVECSQLVQKGILTFRDYNLEGNVVRDIHKMLRTAETCLAEHAEIPCDSYDTWYNKLSNETLNSLKSVSGFKSCSHLFVSVRFGEISHFTVLVKDMLRIYLQLRLCFLNREERIKIQAPREHCMKFNLGRSWT